MVKRTDLLIVPDCSRYSTRTLSIKSSKSRYDSSETLGEAVSEQSDRTILRKAVQGLPFENSEIIKDFKESQEIER